MRSLDRPFVILRVLRENRFPMRLTEIATAANLHVATTQRIVNLLIRHGYVERTGVEYRLGLVSLVDGFTYLSTNGLKQIAEPVLMELTASTRLTSILSVRFELAEVSVLLVSSTPQSRFQAKVGEPVSLMDGGAGILAATLSPEELDHLLDGVEKIPLASGKVLSRQEFIDSLETIRERGYALGQGLGNRSEVSVAVPVMNRADDVVAAIQVTGYIEEIPVDVNSLVAELKRASAAITRRVP
ncbi:MAG TPA: helix-turn-helix domain-containing protein [Acidimicrobiales bacterium]|nr:helix-turn-helix domain-containing protein [Acidimicrobiales bacterium]